MTQILFLAAAYNEHLIDSEGPLAVDDLRAVSAGIIRPGVSKDELFKAKSWILCNQDDYEDMCATLNNWCFQEPQAPVILGFDGLFLIRRLAGNCARRGVRFIPAVWWSGSQSRCYDVMRYLGGGEMMEPRELLKSLKIPTLPIYAPHKDPKLDLKYLIELADKLNLINERLSVDILGTVELPIPDIAAVPQSAIKPQKQQKTKTLKPVNPLS